MNAGPLCESGDIFTRDDRALLAPRQLPRPTAGDLLTLRDTGAYGYAMSSNYNSIGRAPQLRLEEDRWMASLRAPCAAHAEGPSVKVALARAAGMARRATPSTKSFCNRLR